MKRLCVLVTVVVVSLTIGGTALAGDSTPIEVVNLFTWATGASVDWGTGALYAFLGLIGALVTVFSLIGGAIPGTSGSVRIEAGMKRVEEREKILDKLIEEPNKNPEVIKAVEIATNNLRDDMRDDRRRQFALAAALYALLGGFFAALLARDLLQALVIGSGWTACLGALGLKKDYAARKSMKDQTTEKLTEKFEDALSRGQRGQVPEQADWDELRAGWDELRMEAQVSRAL